MRKRFFTIIFLASACFGHAQSTEHSAPALRQYWMNPNVPPVAPPLVVNFADTALAGDSRFSRATLDAPPGGLDAASMTQDSDLRNGSMAGLIEIWLINVDAENSRRGWSSFFGAFVRPSIHQVCDRAHDRLMEIRDQQANRMLAAANAYSHSSNAYTQDRVRRDLIHERNMASQQRQFASEEASAYQDASSPEERAAHRERAAQYGENARGYEADARKSESQLEGYRSGGCGTVPADSPNASPSGMGRVLQPTLEEPFSMTEIAMIGWCACLLPPQEVVQGLGPMTVGQQKQLGIPTQAADGVSSPRPIPRAEPVMPPTGNRGAWMFPDSDSRLLRVAELANLDSESLWRARNEMFARRGYAFSGEKGRRFAASLGSGYEGTDPDSDRVFSKMNPIEQANVRLIRSMEESR